jgi:hypothetical protein
MVLTSQRKNITFHPPPKKKVRNALTLQQINDEKKATTNGPKYQFLGAIIYHTVQRTIQLYGYSLHLIYTAQKSVGFMIYFCVCIHYLK